MKESLFVVLFELILLSNVSFGYDVYQVASGDLLKGVLLGAILASQKNYPNIPAYNYMPLPYSHNFQASSPHQSYATNNPSFQDREKAYSMNHLTREESDRLAQQSGIVSHKRPTTSTTTTSPFDNLHQQLGLPPKSLIVMILPSFLDEEQDQTFNKQSDDVNEENGQQFTKDGQRDHNQMDNDQESYPTNHVQTQTDPTDNSQTDNDYFRTNAIKVGSKQILKNYKGWKPVPNQLTTSTPETEVKIEYNTYMPYIEKSVFGLKKQQ